MHAKINRRESDRYALLDKEPARERQASAQTVEGGPQETRVREGETAGPAVSSSLQGCLLAPQPLSSPKPVPRASAHPTSSTSRTPPRTSIDAPPKPEWERWTVLQSNHSSYFPDDLFERVCVEWATLSRNVGFFKESSHRLPIDRVLSAVRAMDLPKGDAPLNVIGVEAQRVLEEILKAQTQLVAAMCTPNASDRYRPQRCHVRRADDCRTVAIYDDRRQRPPPDSRCLTSYLSG